MVSCQIFNKKVKETKMKKLPIYIINLEKSTDRKAYMQAQFLITQNRIFISLRQLMEKKIRITPYSNVITRRRD